MLLRNHVRSYGNRDRLDLENSQSLRFNEITVRFGLITYILLVDDMLLETIV